MYICAYKQFDEFSYFNQICSGIAEQKKKIPQKWNMNFFSWKWLIIVIPTIFWQILFHFLQICSLLRGGIAERGGVRVGHRIIEINGQSVVAVPHEKIVNLLATSVGEVRN